MLLRLAAIAFAVPTLASAQTGIEVQTTSLLGRPNITTVNFSAKNSTGRSLPVVFVDCTFFGEKSEPIETKKGMVQNVQNGETAHGTVSLVVARGAVKTAACRYSHAG